MPYLNDGLYKLGHGRAIEVFVTGIFLLITNSQWGYDLASFQANLSHLILLPENRLHLFR